MAKLIAGLFVVCRDQLMQSHRSINKQYPYDSKKINHSAMLLEAKASHARGFISQVEKTCISFEKRGHELQQEVVGRELFRSIFFGG